MKDSISFRARFLYSDGQKLIDEIKVIEVKNGVIIEEREKKWDIDLINYTAIPAFSDLHLHFPQFWTMGKFKGTLFEWLEHIIDEEEKYNNLKFAEETAFYFKNALIKNGILYAGVYGSKHARTIRYLINFFKRYPLHIILGKVIMDRGGNTEKEWQETLSLLKMYRERTALIPRFAPSVTEEMLIRIGNYVKKNPQTFVFTHLSETKDEIATVKKLFKNYSSYTELYEKTGILSQNTLLGHGIYLTDDELNTVKRNGSWIIHCPSSNFFLHSGNMKTKYYLDKGIKIGMGSDIGAGVNLDFFELMRIAYFNSSLKLHKLLYMATRRDALGVRFLGGFKKGDFADFILLKGYPDIDEIVFKYNSSLIKEVFFRGKLIEENLS